MGRCQVITSRIRVQPSDEVEALPILCSYVVAFLVFVSAILALFFFGEVAFSEGDYSSPSVSSSFISSLVAPACLSFLEVFFPHTFVLLFLFSPISVLGIGFV
jgi:hypothetical protein